VIVIAKKGRIIVHAAWLILCRFIAVVAPFEHSHARLKLTTIRYFEYIPAVDTNDPVAAVIDTRALQAKSPDESPGAVDPILVVAAGAYIRPSNDLFEALDELITVKHFDNPS